MKLREIAHSRSGDKGDISNISLIMFDPMHFEWVRKHVTESLVAEHFRDIATGKVERYEMPAIHAFNYVLNEALGGGVLRSLAIDTHGKSMSALLLDIDIPAPTLPAGKRPGQDRSLPGTG